MSNSKIDAQSHESVPRSAYSRLRLRCFSRDTGNVAQECEHKEAHVP